MPATAVTITADGWLTELILVIPTCGPSICAD